MGVLTRDAASYASKVDAYNRHLRSYNNDVKEFNGSMYTDASGNQAGLINGQWTQNAPADKTGFALYADQNGQQVLRRYDATTPEQATWVGGFRDGRSIRLPSGDIISANTRTLGQLGEQLVQRGYAPTQLNPYAANNGDPITLQRPVFSGPPTAPGEFTGVKPDPSMAQMRAELRPNAADMERGLIGEVLHGSGLKVGIPKTGTANATKKADLSKQPTITVPADVPGTNFTPVPQGEAPLPLTGTAYYPYQNYEYSAQ